MLSIIRLFLLLLSFSDVCLILLEDPLTPDEIVQALKRLKRGKAGGPDNLSPEHLKFGGSVLQRWLL